MAHKIEGACACGAVTVKVELTTAPSDTALRACGCTFCRRHGAVNFSDPEGYAVISGARDHAGRFQFAARTADFLFCMTCGSYVGAVVTSEKGRLYSTLNARGLDLQALLDGREAAPVCYDEESPSERIDRRLRNWTPTVFSPVNGER